jgi:hypothetical protein
MAFPAQYFYSIPDVAGRWGCSQTEVVNWAIVGELDLVAGFSPILFGDEPAAGLLVVSAADVRPLFRPFGKAAKKVCLKQARPAGSETLRLITEPARGVRLTAADIMITAREIDRFEEAHGIGRTRSAGPGAPGRYNWEGFHWPCSSASTRADFRCSSVAWLPRCRTGSSPIRPMARHRTRARYAAGSGRSGRN